MKLRLTGKTQHGKNRVNENGEIWESCDDVTSPLRCQQMLIQSPKTGNLRWIHISNDPDFDIKIVE